MKVVRGKVGIHAKNLIYFSCSGDKFINEALIAVKSIKANGNFTGDVIVFTDTEQSVPVELSSICRVIQVKLGHRKKWMAGRFLMKDHLDFVQYDKVMHLDTDIVCIKDINLIFNKHYTGLTIVNENHLLSRWKSARCYLTDTDLEKHRNHYNINAGTFIVDGDLCNKLFSSWLYYYENKSLNGKRNDQAAYQKMIFDGYLNMKISELPRELVTMVSQEKENPETVLLHYCGIRDCAAMMEQQGERHESY